MGWLVVFLRLVLVCEVSAPHRLHFIVFWGFSSHVSCFFCPCQCQAFDEGNKERNFPHALVAGLERAPQTVTKNMSKKKILKRTRVKPFVKFINYQHIMPTRYQTNDINVKDAVIPSSVKKADKKSEIKTELKKMFKTKCVFFFVTSCFFFFPQEQRLICLFCSVTDRYLSEAKPSAAVAYFYKKLRF